MRRVARRRARGAPRGAAELPIGTAADGGRSRALAVARSPHEHGGASARHLRAGLRRGRGHPGLGREVLEPMSGRSIGRVGLCCAALAAAAAFSPRARADEARADGGELGLEVDAIARVTSSTSELRAGPGLGYRVVHRAERGETYPIQGREGTGYWLRVYLPDGRTAYLLGDTAETLLLDELAGAGASRPGVFAPPPLASARGGLAMAGGVFDSNGYAELKPAFVVNASLSLEPYVGLVMSAAGRSLLY